MPNLSPNLSLQMSQQMQMVMTPQMIQSMEMLQLPLMALEQRIQQEILENPALEMRDLAEEADEEGATALEAEEEEEPSTAAMAEASEDLSRVDEIDYDWDELHDETSPRRSAEEDDEERYNALANVPGREISFPDYLESQLPYETSSERQRRLCQRIIAHLDAAGYLHTPLAELIDPTEQPPVAISEMEEALAIVQRLDPPGVGARNLQECLRLQLERLGGGPPLARAIVEKHLEDLAANRLPQIAKALGCDLEEVKAAAAFLKTLKPQPGLGYGPGGISQVQPDVLVTLNDAGELEVRLAGTVQPEISEIFLALFDTTGRGRKLREKFLSDPEKAAEFRQMQEMLKNGEHGRHLREKYQAARWLVTAVAQRERTLLRVAQAIVAAQRQFLSGQSDSPAPLMMQTVARELGLDISTVSRTVRDKYMATPVGLKPMRMFFVRAVAGQGDSGEGEIATAFIKNRIQQLIANEDKRAPLKDHEIQARLAQEGIAIKRRTVAKYRAELGFPSHAQRQQY
ncbi:MAG: RNA polymerase factor sigma-54 [Planctomycetota bacterium]|nr:RNA polymerase factor sigma-54 [Planctomycetota bacterium]